MTEFQCTIPLLVYGDIERAHDFLVDAFGFGPSGIELDGVRDHEGHRWWFATPQV
jgi:uncharacterized glyoxalase superfamily protein PhnB